MMQPDITFQMLSVYKAVFEMGSFSAVARSKGVSPSMVSRVIQSLEASVGKQLINRNTRSLVPTHDGHIFYRFACSSLEIFEQCEHDLTAQLDEPAGLIRINAPLIFGRMHIAPWIVELTRQYPLLKIELNQTDSFIDPHKEPVDLLFRISPLEDSSFHAKVFCQQRYYLAASPDYIPQHEAWQDACKNMDNAGFRRVAAFNPYWDIKGTTFEDEDGYRVVIQNNRWRDNP